MSMSNTLQNPFKFFSITPSISFLLCSSIFINFSKSLSKSLSLGFVPLDKASYILLPFPSLRNPLQAMISAIDDLFLLWDKLRGLPDVPDFFCTASLNISSSINPTSTDMFCSTEDSKPDKKFTKTSSISFASSPLLFLKKS